MPRHRVLLVVGAAVAAIVVGGCSTFTDNDVVARVDDDELTEADLRDALGDDTLGDGEIVAATDVRSLVASFLIAEVLTADLETLGVPVPTVDTAELALADALAARRNAVAATWTSLAPDVLVDDSVRTIYDQDSSASGIICPAHVLVATRAEAESVIADYENGAAFADLAAQRSIDTTSGAAGGFLGCLAPQDAGRVFVPEFGEAATGAEIGVPVGPVETEFGFHVIRLVPAEEFDIGAAVAVRLLTFEDRYDIWVNPRFGEWDPASILVPVG